MRLTVVVALALIAAVTGAVLAQPAPIPGPTAPAPGAPRTGAAPDFGQMVDRIAEGLGMTAAEKAATMRAVRAKSEAAQALQTELRALGELARNPQATDRQLTAALQKFDAALATYRQRVRAIDAELVKALSVKARAGLTALGVIDNGLGMRFGAGMRPGGTEGFGGRRGADTGTRR